MTMFLFKLTQIKETNSDELFFSCFVLLLQNTEKNNIKIKLETMALYKRKIKKHRENWECIKHLRKYFVCAFVKLFIKLQ